MKVNIPVNALPHHNRWANLQWLTWATINVNRTDTVMDKSIMATVNLAPRNLRRNCFNLGSNPME
jgi:hypothetical protein